MKEKIINIIVIVVMVVIANYPLYKSLKTTSDGLKSTSDELNVIIKTVQDEVVAWQRDVNNVQDRVEEIRIDINKTINSGLGQIDSTLIKIKALESDVKVLVDKIDSLKINTINKVENKVDEVENKIEEIKKEPVETLKNLFKIKG